MYCVGTPIFIIYICINDTSNNMLNKKVFLAILFVAMPLTAAMAQVTSDSKDKPTVYMVSNAHFD